MGLRSYLNSLCGVCSYKTETIETKTNSQEHLEKQKSSITDSNKQSFHYSENINNTLLNQSDKMQELQKKSSIVLSEKSKSSSHELTKEINTNRKKSSSSDVVSKVKESPEDTGSNSIPKDNGISRNNSYSGNISNKELFQVSMNNVEEKQENENPESSPENLSVIGGENQEKGNNNFYEEKNTEIANAYLQSKENSEDFQQPDQIKPEEENIDKGDVNDSIEQNNVMPGNNNLPAHGEMQPAQQLDRKEHNENNGTDDNNFPAENIINGEEKSAHDIEKKREEQMANVKVLKSILRGFKNEINQLKENDFENVSPELLITLSDGLLIILNKMEELKDLDKKFISNLETFRSAIFDLNKKIKPTDTTLISGSLLAVGFVLGASVIWDRQSSNDGGETSLSGVGKISLFFASIGLLVSSGLAWLYKNESDKLYGQLRDHTIEFENHINSFETKINEIDSQQR